MLFQTSYLGCRLRLFLAR